MVVEKGYPCAYQIHYHIVFPVKYRRALLRKEVGAVVREVAVGIEERYGMEVESLGGDRHYIPLLCSAHPKDAPGELVRLFKRITARELFARVPGLKRSLWGGEVLERRLPRGHRGRARQLGRGGKVRAQPGFKEDKAQLRLL